MGLTLTEKILMRHTTDKLIRGDSISIRIDQCLAPDSTATLVFLELLKLNPKKINLLSVTYIDHNTMQNGPMNMDDHIFLQECCQKYGTVLSKAGNGISHQIHLERYTKPGVIILGADTYTATNGALCALGLSSGAIDIAMVMAGSSYKMLMPKIVKINLKGKFKRGVSSKDLALYILSKTTLHVGANYILEFDGEGLNNLSVFDRIVIANMSAEMGALSAIFPSDDQTKKFLEFYGREESFERIKADSDAIYDYEYDIDMENFVPLAACPSRIYNIKPITDIEGIKVDQVIIGACSNGSINDFIYAANVLKNYPLNKNVSLAVIPGSRHTLSLMIKMGILSIFVQAGARILEPSCGACMGLGQSPMTGGVSLRTFNRNYKGRSGTNSASIYIVSPEVAISSAVKGYISSPIQISQEIKLSNNIPFNDSLIVNEMIDIIPTLGPNIIPIPHFDPVGFKFNAKVMLECGNDITTDQIMPSSPHILPYRSNIERLSDYLFSDIDPLFVKRCKDNNGGVIMAGANYGLGASSEHGVIALRYLGIKAIIARSFSYLQRRSLINFGIIPIEAYIAGHVNDEIHIDIDSQGECLIENITTNAYFKTKLDFTEDEFEAIKNGGII